MPYLIAVLAALSALFAVAAVWPQGRAGKRQPRDAQPNLVDTVPGGRAIAHALAPVIRRIAPDVVARLDRKLVLAGRPMGRVEAAHLLALGVAGGMLYAPLMALLGAWALGVGGFLAGLLFGLAFILVCIFVRVDGMVAKRTQRLDQQFPYFLDFLVMMKEAGEITPNALGLYVAAVGRVELGDAIRVVSDGIANHKDGLRGALMDFHDDCPSEIGKSTLRSIVKAEEMGARSTAMLRDIARDIRGKRYEQAEKIAEKIKANSNVPAVVMFAGAFIIILSGSLGKMFNVVG